MLTITWNGVTFPSASMKDTSNSSTLMLSSRPILPMSTGEENVMINVVTGLTNSNGSEESGLQVLNTNFITQNQSKQ